MSQQHDPTSIYVSDNDPGPINAGTGKRAEYGVEMPAELYTKLRTGRSWGLQEPCSQDLCHESALDTRNHGSPLRATFEHVLSSPWPA